jgi:diphosphomevalonate decarboxylase
MRATARAHPNIALIKYWGKRDSVRNLPAAGSISATLGDLWTSMTVDLDGSLEADVLTVNGRDRAELLPRVARCLDDVLGTSRAAARVASRANFPIAAGIASSASAFAALVVAADAAGGTRRSTAELASLAGRASGSAARSLYGGFVELQPADGDVTVTCLRPASGWPLRVVIAVTDAGPKPVGSTEAMEISRATSPFYARWLEQQADDLAAARAAIAARDFSGLAAVAEHNCLKMHSVMWSSRPPIVYWNGVTLDCMRAVRKLRSEAADVFFTIDAGPQVKAFCAAADEARVHAALAAVAGVTDVLVSGLGEAAVPIDDA